VVDIVHGANPLNALHFIKLQLGKIQKKTLLLYAEKHLVNP